MAETVRCPQHDGRDCINCGGTGRVEAINGRPWWEDAFRLPGYEPDEGSG